MMLGVWVIILPFLGFPGFWQTMLMLASGLIIVGIAYSMRPSGKPVASSNIPYVEHKNQAAAPSAMPAEKPVSSPEIPPSTPVNN
jgi:hypothetical protein